MCCSYGDGGYEVSYDGELLKSGGAFGREESTIFGGECPTTEPSSSLSPSESPSIVTCSGKEKRFELKLVPDRYPEETSWYLKNICTGETVLDGGANSVVQCINDDAEYEFSIYDSYGDGLCCGGLYEIFYDDNLAKSGDSFGFNESTAIGGGCPSAAPSVSPSPTTFCPSGNDLIQLELKTDKYPGDTSWELISLVTNMTMYSSGYRKYNLEGYIYDELLCVPRNETCYELRMYDSYGDGICCSSGYGYYEISYKDALVKRVENFTSSEFVTTFGPGCNMTNSTTNSTFGSTIDLSSRKLFHAFVKYLFPQAEDEVLDWQK